MCAGGQALNSTLDLRVTCGTVETDPAVLALYHEECNATDLEVWTALPLDISSTGLRSRNLIIHGYTVQVPPLSKMRSGRSLQRHAVSGVADTHSGRQAEYHAFAAR